MPLNLTAKQARAYVAAAANKSKPTKEQKPSQKRTGRPVRREKARAGHSSPPTVGKRYRVAQDLKMHYSTPPPVGSIVTVWYVQPDGLQIWMEGTREDSCAEFSIISTLHVLREFFTEEED